MQVSKFVQTGQASCLSMVSHISGANASEVNLPFFFFLIQFMLKYPLEMRDASSGTKQNWHKGRKTPAFA